VQDNDPTLEANADALSKAQTLAHGVPSIPGYRLDRKLGEGTFGEVWLARAEKTNVAVAIKIFKHRAGEQWEFLKGEVGALATVNADQGIVRLIDADFKAQPPFYVMDFLENGSLAQRLKKGSLSVTEALDFFRQIAAALAYMHEKGICHCDLTPANILLDSRGAPRIADFGQAHLASDATPALGTFFYMAPEQATTDNVAPDPRWDVYALGALFYAMVTGRPPREDGGVRRELEGTTAFDHRLKLYRDGVHAAPKPIAHRTLPRMDRQLADIIDSCLELKPERRFANAKDVVKALELRERLHKHKTMMQFGLVGPMVIILIMGLVTLSLGRKAIGKAEADLLRQIKEGDLASARLVAEIVDEQLTDKMEVVKRVAVDGKLRDALLDPQSSVYLKRLGDIWTEDEQKRIPLLKPVLADPQYQVLTGLLARVWTENESESFSRWTLSSSNGVTLANWPIEVNNTGKRFAWRDWFSGRGDQLGQKNRNFAPIRKPHFSQPFIGQSQTPRPIVALSVPIESPNGQKVLGVLQVSVRLEKLQEWLEKAEFNGGFPVLVNDRFHVVQHLAKTNNGSQLLTPDANPISYKECAVFANAVVPEWRLNEAGGGTTDEYEDPIDGKKYLAGYAPANKLGWAAIVQHEITGAKKSVSELRRTLTKTGWIVLIAAIVLLVLQWFLLRRALRGNKDWLYGLLSRSRSQS
jgi:hypothetical protein